MSKTRTLSLILLAIAATGLTAGTLGGTSFLTAGDTSAEVVDDTHAYVGYQSSDLTASDGETVELVTVTNRGSDAIEVADVTIVDGDATVTTTFPPNIISPGEEGTVQATVSCTSAQVHRIAVTISVTASEDVFRAHLSGDTISRSFYLRCVQVEAAESEHNEGG